MVPYSIMRALAGCLSPCYWHWAHRWLYQVCDCGLWVPHLLLPSHLKSITAFWLVPSYTTWWQRYTGV